MANASSGEPMVYRHAVALYSAQSTQGTAVAPATSCGLAMVGRTLHSDNRYFQAPGSPTFQARKGGGAFADWSIRLAGVQTGTKALIQKAARASGVLPFLTLGFGYQDDQGTPNRSADQIQDCKVNTLELALEAGDNAGVLTANLSGMGGLVTALTTLAPAQLTTAPYASYEGVFTKAGSAFPLRSFNLSLNHNLRRDYVIPGATPASYVRGWSYLTEQAEVVTGSISRYAASGVNVQAATLSTFAMQLVLTNVDDATTLTLALALCDFGDDVLSEDENGLIWTNSFRGTTLTIS